MYFIVNFALVLSVLSALRGYTINDTSYLLAIVDSRYLKR